MGHHSMAHLLVPLMGLLGQDTYHLMAHHRVLHVVPLGHHALHMGLMILPVVPPDLHFLPMGLICHPKALPAAHHLAPLSDHHMVHPVVPLGLPLLGHHKALPAAHLDPPLDHLMAQPLLDHHLNRVYSLLKTQLCTKFVSYFRLLSLFYSLEIWRH